MPASGACRSRDRPARRREPPRSRSPSKIRARQYPWRRSPEHSSDIAESSNVLPKLLAKCSSSITRCVRESRRPCIVVRINYVRCGEVQLKWSALGPRRAWRPQPANSFSLPGNCEKVAPAAGHVCAGAKSASTTTQYPSTPKPHNLRPPAYGPKKSIQRANSQSSERENYRATMADGAAKPGTFSNKSVNISANRTKLKSKSRRCFGE